MASNQDDDEYIIPLRDQRYFGAGIKRKRIQFVPPSSAIVSAIDSPSVSSSSAAERYLSIVLKPSSQSSGPDSSAKLYKQEQPEEYKVPQCNICNHPIHSTSSSTPHEAALVHQICLEHSHPPFDVDRCRKAFGVLSSQGWDPESHKGLGVSGQGVLHPIKARENPKRAGLGLKASNLKKQRGKKVEEPKLDAGKTRALEAQHRRAGQRLRDAFYRSEDVEKYLKTVDDKD